MEKRVIIEEYMDFSEAEARLFWPVYDEYADKRKKLAARRIATLQDYVSSYNNLQ